MAVVLKLKSKSSELKKAREAKGFTQLNLADFLSAYFERDINVHTVAKWENAGRLVDLKTAKAIAEMLEVPVHKIFVSAHRDIKIGTKDMKKVGTRRNSRRYE